MQDEGEPPLNMPKIAAIIIMILNAIALVLYGFVADPLPEIKVVFDILYVIGFGICFPIIILVLAMVGTRTYDRSEYIALAVGIGISITSGILIALTALWIFHDITALIDYLEYLAFYIGIVACEIGTLIMQILCLIGGIQTIKYYNKLAYYRP